MANTWYYTKNNQQQGPVTMEQLKSLVGAGQLLPTDQVWQEGTSGWVPASQVKELFPSPPPTPPPVGQSAPPPPPPPIPSPGGTAGGAAFFTKVNELSARWGKVVKPELRPKVLMGYWGAAGLTFISVFLPWGTVSGLGEHEWWSGIRSTYGVITLLFAIGGGVLSFLKPGAFLKEKAKFVMAILGVGAFLFSLIGLISVPSGGLHGVFSYGPGFGIFLAILGGLAMALVGFINDW